LKIRNGVQREWFRPVPLRQRRGAVASAIAATGVFAFVTERGHSIDRLPDIPYAVDGRAENVSKTKDAVALLKGLRVYDDVKRVIDGKCDRSSKGKMRRSAFKTKRGSLVVYQTDGAVVKAFRNIPGLDIQNVQRVSICQLAFTALDQIYSDKRGFGILVNTDAKQIAASDEVTSVLRRALQTFSVPGCRCPSVSGSRPRNGRRRSARPTPSGPPRRPRRARRKRPARSLMRS
jgi:large subunit ribosomal protein L4e